MENNVSPRNVLVAKVCPYELQEKVLISINSKAYNWIVIGNHLRKFTTYILSFCEQGFDISCYSR